MKKLLLILSISLSFNSFSQTIWGAGSTDTNYDNAGRFATAFGSPNGWTAVGSSSPTALWTRTTNGLSQGAYATGQPVIGSPSMNDGAALYDSDFLDNGGVPNNFGLGTCPAPHKGQLLSPSFDLTGYTNTNLQAKLFLFYRNYSINELSMSFSSDGGSTWADFSINQGVSLNATFQPAFITVPLTGVTTGVSDLSNCKVRLTFDGNYYFAMIDDISIETNNPNQDIAIAAPDAIYNYKTTASPAPYKTLPLQIAKTYYPYNYAALVKNNGNTDIPLTSNPKVHYDLSKNISGTWTSLLSADVNITNPIVANDTISVYGDITSAMQSTFNTNGIGDYRFMYIVHHDLTDVTATNDSAFHYFTITPDYSWYSSSPLLSDGGPAYSNSEFPSTGGGNVIQELEWGGLYYFADTTNIAIDSVKYRMKVPANFNLANTSVTTLINLYEWVDNNADQLIDYSSELILRALTVDNLSISNSDLNTYVLGKVKLADPNTLNPNTFQYDLPYGLKNGNTADGLYYISVSQTNSAGLIDLNGDINCVYPATNEMPYEWSKEFSQDALTPLRVTEGFPNSSGSTSWYSGFAGPYAAPSIALSIVDYANALNPVGVNEKKNESAISVYPNPTANTIKVNTNLIKQSLIVRYILTDANGRVLNMEKHKNVQNEVYTLDVTKLSAGTYFMHVKSDEGNTTKAFIKQ